MQDETGAATPAVGTLSQKRLGKQRAVEPMSDEIQDESQDENQVVVVSSNTQISRKTYLNVSFFVLFE